MRNQLSKSIRLSTVAGVAVLALFSASCSSRAPAVAVRAASPRRRPVARLTNTVGTPVNLTAQRMTITLRDGTTAPMWGYCPTGTTCTSWAPGPTIVATAGSSLQINLTNDLPVPTSLVVPGQLGGGLGTPTTMASPTHTGQNNTTFPTNGPAPAPFVPPAQGPRVRSFGVEVSAASPTGPPATVTLSWNNLKPGTYLYETGTLPSLQVPMGLYGVLVVTTAPASAVTGTCSVTTTTACTASTQCPSGETCNTTTTFTPGTAYPGISYDDDVALLFSELDPVQNAAVDAAAQFQAAHPAIDITNLRFNDPACGTTCYPAAVNYAPTYFLINGQYFDLAAPENSAFTVADATPYSSGNILVRLLNAGSRTHYPSMVGLPMSLVAEDGNLAPGKPKLQNVVLLTAGKTHDVLVRPAASGTAYAPATYPVFDRGLDLSTDNHPDGGMQGFLLVSHASAASTLACSGTATACTTSADCATGQTCSPVYTAGAPGNLPATVVPAAVNDLFKVPFNTATSNNVTTNDVAIAQVALGTGPAHGNVILNANGSFTYTPNTGYSGTDTFTYVGNGNPSLTATVTLDVAAQLAGAANMPVATADSLHQPVHHQVQRGPAWRAGQRHRSQRLPAHRRHGVRQHLRDRGAEPGRLLQRDRERGLLPVQLRRDQLPGERQQPGHRDRELRPGRRRLGPPGRGGRCRRRHAHHRLPLDAAGGPDLQARRERHAGAQHAHRRHQLPPQPHARRGDRLRRPGELRQRPVGQRQLGSAHHRVGRRRAGSPGHA